VSKEGEEVAILSFSEDMERLQEIVRAFEAGNLAMEDSLTLFEEGVGLIKGCRKYLETARRRVTMLAEDGEVECGTADG
jgi:Exonuclease VII small subunit